MNYYNPYFSSYPYTTIPTKTGLFSRLFGNNINLGSILSGTQKTLNIVNQAIPIIKQAGPVINNAKTMFKVAGAIRNSDRKAIQTNNINHSNSNNNSFDNNQRKQTSDLEFLNTSNNIHSYNNPTFFL